MQCYSELTPPTAASHAITLPFVSAHALNLVVAKSSLLQVFRVKNVTTEVEAAETYGPRTGQSDKNGHDGFSFLGADATIRPDRTSATKLILVAEFPLSGTINGLARIKTSRRSRWGGDALLLMFKDAKLSLVEWDAETQSLSTLSIHYYEQEDLQGAPWEAPPSEYHNFLASDPGSRCAALKFGPRNLAILPFKQADEDMDMGDWDPVKKPVADSCSVEDTPYSPSFVLRLSNLEPSLLHPVHLAFLHEYREPTFGILFSSQSRSFALGRKDHLTYMVFTLDLQQKASTTILSVTGLPHDLFRVISLPAPIGGALLMGTNELMHVDQSGKTNGVAVNPLTRLCTSFPLVDQSYLGLRLEDSVVETMAAELGELLLVLNDGRLALITFRVDGRTVSGFDVKLVSRDAGGCMMPSGVACLSRLGRASMFAGSEDGDSLVLGWTRKQAGGLSRRKARAHSLDDEELEGEDEDDLYAAPASATVETKPSKPGDVTFGLHDRLPSMAPIRAMTYGQPSADGEAAKNSEGVGSDLQLVCAVGREGAGALAVINRDMQPTVIGRFSFPEAKGIWAMNAKKAPAKSLQLDKESVALGQDYDVRDPFDRFMLVAKIDLDGYETSDVYMLTAAGFESLTGTEFEPAAGLTIEAGTMGKNNRIVQVLKSEVRCYDGDVSLSQILPMLDEETGAEPRVVSASMADPFLLLMRDDASVFLAQIDNNYELEELDTAALTSTKWLTGCLYTDEDGVFAETADMKDAPYGEKVLMFLLSVTGTLYMYRLPHVGQALFVAEGVSCLAPSISASYAFKKGTPKENITEMLVADLGDTVHKSPFLLLRHANDDLTIYQPVLRGGGPCSLVEGLSLEKITNTTFATRAEEADQDDAAQTPRFQPMRACSNIGGYSTVFLPGPSASFVIKAARSAAKVIGLAGVGVQAMSAFCTEGCDHGFIYVDAAGTARVAQFPANTDFDLGVSLRKVPLGLDTIAVAFHAPSHMYVVGCNTKQDFSLPKEEDYRKEWRQENLTFFPRSARGVLQLVSPATWAVVETVELESYEQVLCVSTLDLEVSESTNERKRLVAVGTAITRGEDMATRGRVYVYDVVEVVPEPGRPETGRKLKLVAREDMARGAVTAISHVGTQGLMLVAQGQKCMVRGLKEDGSLLPVAFMDMSCHVACVRELPGTGLCLMADAFKGLWFVGYTEEPYKMILFGKSATNLELLDAAFLPDGNELSLVASDADGYIHIFQFDPDHPKSIQGHLLLHRTAFNANAHAPTTSLLLPRTLPSTQPSTTTTNGATDSPPPHLLLFGSATGLLATLNPLSEASYRRLASLATQLTNLLPHAAALNPRMYRLPAALASAAPRGVDEGMGSRVMVDGAILARWSGLGAGRKVDLASRAGFAGPDEVRAELAALLAWDDMAYF